MGVRFVFSYFKTQAPALEEELGVRRDAPANCTVANSLDDKLRRLRRPKADAPQNSIFSRKGKR